MVFNVKERIYIKYIQNEWKKWIIIKNINYVMLIKKLKRMPRVK